MIERVDSSWIESVSRIFPPKPPKSITIRGDGTGIHYSHYEIAFARIHLLTKKFYRNTRIGSYYRQQEHLANQERTLFMLCYDMGIDHADVINRSSVYIDFVARPMTQSGYFELGLADLLYISANEEIPMILDFHYYNHVIAEKVSPITYLEILRTYVTHFLDSRFPTVDQEKISQVYEYVYNKLDRESEDVKKEFYWYSKEYGTDESNTSTFEENQITQSDKNDKSVPATSEKETRKAVKESNVTGSSPLSRLELPFNTHCTSDLLYDYFHLLSAPKKFGAHYLETSAVDFILSRYFTPTNSPVEPKSLDADSNLTKDELLFFLVQYYDQLTPGSGSSNSVSLVQLLQIAMECFPKMFKSRTHKSLDNLYKNIRKKKWESLIRPDHPLRIENNEGFAGRLPKI